jgi:serine-type D-Ala-D-Ala carboxypeptidase/endopeptidase (penicillin-binding protein 4)
MIFMKKKRTIRIFTAFVICLFILLIFHNSSISQILFKIPKPDTSLRQSPLESLKFDFDALNEVTELKDAHLGISVYSIDKRELLYTYNSQKKFIPASIEKLFTTSTALRYLGQDYKFRTRIYLDGQISNDGEFLGDIIIRSYGDPSLSEYFTKNPLGIFEFLVSILDSLNINTITGNLIGDDNFFDDAYYCQGWQIDDIPYKFSAQINALSVFDNSINIRVIGADDIGAYARIIFEPEISNIRIDNQVIISESNTSANIIPVRQPGENNISLFGNIPFDSSSRNVEDISVTIENPTQYFLNIVKLYLNKNNIQFKGALIDIDDIDFLPDYSLIDNYFTYYSCPLSEIIKVINKQSHNLASEMLLKTIAREYLGYGSTENGIKLIKRYLQKKMNIFPDSIQIVDGSGLSRMNLVSPAQITQFLTSVYNSDFRKIFISSLSVPGEKGTLRRRLINTFAENRIWAKTGTMNNVSAICGYVKTKDNENLAFSIMMMNFTNTISAIQNLQDMICMRLASFQREILPERVIETK